jgi:phosphomannomutase
MKKVIAFDLDGTLAPSKSPLPDRIGLLLTELLDTFQVCVISGGKFEQFSKHDT